MGNIICRIFLVIYRKPEWGRFRSLILNFQKSIILYKQTGMCHCWCATTHESRLLRAGALLQPPPVFTIRAVAFLVHIGMRHCWCAKEVAGEKRGEKGYRGERVFGISGCGSRYNQCIALSGAAGVTVSSTAGRPDGNHLSGEGYTAQLI